MKVLVVEGDGQTRRKLGRLLTDRGFDVTACATAEEAMNAYKTEFFPLLLIDLALPDIDGISFCRWVRHQPEGNKHLILASAARNRSEDLQKVLEAGANDYIAKPYRADTLDVRLTIARQRVKNIELRKSLEANLQEERERLKYLAIHDPLTKLLNRVAFTEALAKSVLVARQGSFGALICIDLDNFKLINDSFGHAAGDMVLSQVASILQMSIRRHDVPFRFGGDEFGVLLQDIDFAAAKLIAERIRVLIEETVCSDFGKKFTVSASIGIAAIDGTASVEEVMASADAACYSAKAHGRNRVQLFDPNDGSIVELRRQKWRAWELKEAIRAQRLEIVFQPIVDLKTTIPAMYEVLVRLPSSDELRLPSTFLPAAERFHLMPEIDRQVITKALPHLAANNSLHLTINLSGQTFGDETLPDFIENSFRTSGLEPGRVIFEITETAVISNLRSAQVMMYRLRAAGFRFALDDFGAGFSSFSHLKDLVTDYLKIDGSYIRDTGNDPASWSFVEMMNDIAHRLKMKSIAEFVQYDDELVKLREIGVDLAQGYLFGKPGPLPPLPSPL
ncbi:MAG TPA: EAL domain-containing protein [Chthoniobacterales bacterium]|nr:EAL domain-containing protein [Chthoniobacterales bacterium]